LASIERFTHLEVDDIDISHLYPGGRGYNTGESFAKSGLTGMGSPGRGSPPTERPGPSPPLPKVKKVKKNERGVRK